MVQSLSRALFRPGFLSYMATTPGNVQIWVTKG